jgi:hypothetical protein
MSEGEIRVGSRCERRCWSARVARSALGRRSNRSIHPRRPAGRVYENGESRRGVGRLICGFARFARHRGADATKTSGESWRRIHFGDDGA